MNHYQLLLRFLQPIYSIVFLLCWNLPAHAFSSHLFPGEALVTSPKYQALVKYIAADSTKPLVIFVPGDAHLARVAYGDANNRPQDFLAYWLHQLGYPFLAISYPTDNPVFTQITPEFSISDWGDLVSAEAQKILKDKLSSHVVIVGWSMGGAIEQTVTASLLQRNITVDAFIGLSAVPPIPEVMQQGAYAANEPVANGLADRQKLKYAMLDLLKEQNQENKHTIITNEDYINKYTGNTPVALVASGLYFKNKSFHKDRAFTINDSGVYDFKNTPWIGLIVDDSPSTVKISSIDPAAWNFLRMEMIYKTELKDVDFTQLPPLKWKELRQLLESIPQQLNLTVHGNHLFFIGEVGAQRTAESIDILLKRIQDTKHTLSTLKP